MDTLYIASPNCDERPDLDDISLIVVHGISLPPGEFGGTAIEQFFTNRLDAQRHPFFQEIKNLQVSSHIFIRRDGEVIQFVPFEKRAWHAGESQYQGRACCNDYSIGIELEGTDDIPYTDAQYTQLAAVIDAILQVFPKTSRERIIGHVDIAPNRKTDPGPSFDWSKLFHVLDARLG
jgi:AmpD protein